MASSRCWCMILPSLVAQCELCQLCVEICCFWCCVSLTQPGLYMFAWCLPPAIFSAAAGSCPAGHPSQWFAMPAPPGPGPGGAWKIGSAKTFDGIPMPSVSKVHVADGGKEFYCGTSCRIRDLNLILSPSTLQWQPAGKEVCGKSLWIWVGKPQPKGSGLIQSVSIHVWVPFQKEKASVFSGDWLCVFWGCPDGKPCN